MNIKNLAEFVLIVVFIGLIGYVLSWPVKTGSEYADTLTISLGGDFYVGPRLKKYGLPDDPGEFASGIPESVRKADLHLINLEAPITNRSDTYLRKRYSLQNPPTNALPLMRELSVDGVSLANNHILDFGPEGLLDTVRHLKSENIRYAGAGYDRETASKPVYFEREGKTIAFLAFSNTYPKEFWAGKNRPGTAYGDPDRFSRRIKKAQKKADHVIVSFHWGGESKLQPKGYQRRFARLAVDRGADVVFGHHPHSLQPIERYNNGLIFYSLGNYFFSTLSRDVEYGLLPEVSLRNDRKRPGLKMHLIRVNNHEVHYRPEHVDTYRRPLNLALRIGRLDFVRLAGRSPVKRILDRSLSQNRFKIDPD